MVIGHWSRDRPDKASRGFLDAVSNKTNLWSFNGKMPRELFDMLVEMYSLPGDYVAHVCPSNGKCINDLLFHVFHLIREIWDQKDIRKIKL